MAEQEGTLVAKGNHVVPNGVAVEELDGGKKKLEKECPPKLEELLKSKQVKHVYDEMVDTIVQASSTRSLFGSWKDQEFNSILDMYREQFATEGGIKVVLCKRKSGSGTFRWLEFIDVDAVDPPDYVPQFDVNNYSGQVIKTCYTTIEFPNGVAAEKLKQHGWNVRQRLKEKIPVYVEELLDAKQLKKEYQEMIDHCVQDGVGKKCKSWNVEKLQQIIDAHKPNFQAKGLDVFLCHKQEWISHGQYGGHYEYYRWLEFVDREQQPNYHPQRDVETKDEKGCVVS